MQAKSSSMWVWVTNGTLFAIAMAHVETMIVVYLRRLYYPEGFNFPLVIIDVPTLLLELEREAATLVMLATFGCAAGRTRTGKLAYFLLTFGVWDIFYYIWLKLILDWPDSLLTWDVLFLIPVPWIGPVIAPVSVACTMIVMALVMLHLERRDRVPVAGRTLWLAQISATLIVFISFIWDVLPRLADNGALLKTWVPVTYRWWMLGFGQALALSSFLLWVWRGLRFTAPGIDRHRPAGDRHVPHMS